MTTDHKIPVLKNIVLAGKPSPLPEGSVNQPVSANRSPDESAVRMPPPVEKDWTHSMRFTTLPEPPGESQDEREKELHTHAEILLGIMEEKLGIYLIRRRKKLLDALVEQLRSYHSKS